MIVLTSPRAVAIVALCIVDASVPIPVTAPTAAIRQEKASPEPLNITKPLTADGVFHLRFWQRTRQATLLKKTDENQDLIYDNSKFTFFVQHTTSLLVL